MKIAIITAGGAGMFCGSCMQDNTLVRTLRMAGEDAVLVPTYTPIRVDEDDVSIDRVFMGGINVYLSSMIPGWRSLPSWMTGWLNRPGVIQRLAGFGTSTDPAKLGSLTLDMLRGSAGPQRRVIHQFVEYLCTDLKPDIIVFSNALLSGVLTELRAAFHGPILCLLQGDDIFLEALSSRWKPRVMDQIRENCAVFDGFLTHSRYYREFMVEYLGLPVDKFRQIPLTVDTAGFEQQKPVHPASERFCIGYFARICPEKGIQNLLAAAEPLLAASPHTELVIAGFLPKLHESWFRGLLDKVQNQYVDRVFWLGSPPDRATKISLLKTFDVLCVPASYHEPKGLYVLEAGLAGVPSVVPAHGAFPELTDSLDCGHVYDTQNPGALAECLLNFREQFTLTEGLPERIRQRHGMQATSTAIRDVIVGFVTSQDSDDKE